MIKSIVEWVDKLIPGYKTYALLFVGIGMAGCQFYTLKYTATPVTFTSEEWTLLIAAMGLTTKMGMDRGK